jgi:hypothetical protein
MVNDEEDGVVLVEAFTRNCIVISSGKIVRHPATIIQRRSKRGGISKVEQRYIPLFGELMVTNELLEEEEDCSDIFQLKRRVFIPFPRLKMNLSDFP